MLLAESPLVVYIRDSSSHSHTNICMCGLPLRCAPIVFFHRERQLATSCKTFTFACIFTEPPASFLLIFAKSLNLPKFSYPVIELFLINSLLNIPFEYNTLVWLYKLRNACLNIYNYLYKNEIKNDCLGYLSIAVIKLYDQGTS